MPKKSNLVIPNSEEEQLFNLVMGFPRDHGFGRELLTFFPNWYKQVPDVEALEGFAKRFKWEQHKQKWNLTPERIRQIQKVLSFAQCVADNTVRKIADNDPYNGCYIRYKKYIEGMEG